MIIKIKENYVIINNDKEYLSNSEDNEWASTSDYAEIFHDENKANQIANKVDGIVMPLKEFAVERWIEWLADYYYQNVKFRKLGFNIKRFKDTGSFDLMVKGLESDYYFHLDNYGFLKFALTLDEAIEPGDMSLVIYSKRIDLKDKFELKNMLELISSMVNTINKNQDTWIKDIDNEPELMKAFDKYGFTFDDWKYFNKRRKGKPFNELKASS